MEENKLEPAHFYHMYLDKRNERVYRDNKNKLSDDDDMGIYECIDFHSINKNDLKSIILGAINDTCMEYLNESDSNISVIPNDTFEFIDYILEEDIESIYKDNFIFSLNFIYQDYLNLLNKGYPYFESSIDDSGMSEYIMVLNSENEIIKFESIGLKEEEQAKIITSMFRMDYNNQLGPYHPKVHMKKVSWR